MKGTHQSIIEDLRDQARFNAVELRQSAETMPEWDAADLIEELMAALQQIADGSPDAQKIARKALDPIERIIKD